MKRILILSDINSAHTQKWVTSLLQKGFYIGLFSISVPKTEWYKQLPNLEVFHSLGFEQKQFHKKSFLKFSFLRVLPSLKKTIAKFNPDIVHSHYASSYGLIGALSKFHPFLISAWGSDIFDFPRQNLFNKFILKFNLKRADKILSTSQVMKKEIALYSNKPVEVIPFGIDTMLFKPVQSEEKEEVVIGTIKSLEEIYGIRYLIEAFKILKDKFPNNKLKLLLVGGGTKEKEYKQLAMQLGLTDDVTFTGLIPYSEVANYHRLIDIYVAVSLSESFGVAVLEASACEKPVVVSNVGGLPEVVRDGETGFIIEPSNAKATASAIETLLLDKNLRKTFGANGRKMVLELYDWEMNISKMISTYTNL